MSSLTRDDGDHEDTSVPQLTPATEHTALLRGNEDEDQNGNAPSQSCSHPHPDPGSEGIYADEANAPDTTVAERPLKDVVLIMVAVWLGCFLAALDMTIISTIAAPISSDFGSLTLVSWLSTAYLISTSACQPLSGKLTDIFSRRNGLVVCNLFFALGNLISGLAPTPWTIIVGRTVAGMGGGGLTSITTFISTDLIPLRRRGLWQGIGNVFYGTGAAVGGLFGGFVSDVFGWRCAFLVQVPLVLFSIALVVWKVDMPPATPENRRSSRLRRVDFPGALTLILTLVSLLLGLNSGGNLVPWSHPLVVVSLPLSAVFLLLFVYVEERIAPEPIIPVRLLLDPTVLSGCLANWLGTMSVFALLIYMPIFFQVQGHSATGAGARLAPYAIGTSLGSLGFGFLMRATGRYRSVGYASVLSIVAGSYLVARFELSTTSWAMAATAMGVFGVGYGGLLTVTLVALLSAVDHRFQAVVTSASYAFRSTGSCIGITVVSAAYQNLLTAALRARLAGAPDAPRIIEQLRNNLDAVKQIPAELRPPALASYMDALHGVFLVSLGMSVLAALSFVGVREHTLHSTLDRNS